MRKCKSNRPGIGRTAGPHSTSTVPRRQSRSWAADTQHLAAVAEQVVTLLPDLELARWGSTLLAGYENTPWGIVIPETGHQDCT